MKRIAVYGKGGIGKSTVTSNVSVALAESGLKVLQIGCDPKSDSTRLLMNGKKQTTVLDAMASGSKIKLEDIVHQGEQGCYCVECGGPRPGTGCAGRGIIAAFQMLEELNAVDVLKPDVILYDVLGDVVCGGFAMPIRNGYAKDVFIVTSGEMMSLYAANNIATAVNDLSGLGYAKLTGIIQNSKGVENEDSIINDASKSIGVNIIGRIPRDPTIQKYESILKTAVSGNPQSPLANTFRELASRMISLSTDCQTSMRG